MWLQVTCANFCWFVWIWVKLGLVNLICLKRLYQNCLLLKRLYQNSPEWCLLRKTLPKLTVRSCDSQYMWLQVTCANFCWFVWIWVRLGLVNLVCLKRLCQNSLGRLYQNSPEWCLLRQILAKLTVRSCDSRSLMQTFIDLCRFESGWG